MFALTLAVSKSLLLGTAAAHPVARPGHRFAYDCFAFAVSYSERRGRRRDRAVVSQVVRLPASRRGSCHRAEAEMRELFARELRRAPHRAGRGSRYTPPVVYTYGNARRAEIQRRDLMRRLERSRWRVRTERIDLRRHRYDLPGRVNPRARVRVIRKGT